MKIVKADWDGFADDVVDLVIRNKGEVTLGIDDVRVAARSDARNVYQRWWWNAEGNRAHPQFGGFFQHFLQVIPNTAEDGRVGSVTFRPRRSGLGGTLLKTYWRVRHLFKSDRRREVRGWADFSDYLLDRQMEGGAKREVELPIDSVRLATHTRDSMIYSLDWWRSEQRRRDRRTRALLERHVSAEAIPSGDSGGGVARVRFRMDGGAR